VKRKNEKENMDGCSCSEEKTTGKENMDRCECSGARQRLIGRVDRGSLGYGESL
jgi:hypothetical protein